MTLDRFLVQRQQNRPGASGELTRVLVQLGVVAKIISSYLRRSALEGLKGVTGETNVQGEKVKRLTNWAMMPLSKHSSMWGSWAPLWLTYIKSFTTAGYTSIRKTISEQAEN